MKKYINKDHLRFQHQHDRRGVQFQRLVGQNQCKEALQHLQHATKVLGGIRLEPFEQDQAVVLGDRQNAANDLK